MNKPRRGEIVIAKVNKVQSYNALLTLVEYPGVKAYIHVSQVSVKWVKDINNHLKEGKEVIAKVGNNKGKRLELSMKKVSPIEKTKKLRDYQDEKKSNQILDAVSKKINQDKNKIVPKIKKEYGSLRLFIEALRKERKKVFDEISLPNEWKKPLLNYTKTERKELELRKEIKAYSLNGKGVEVLKKELKHKKFDINYITAPKYSVLIKGYDYKKMEKKFQDYVKKITESNKLRVQVDE